MWSQSGFGIWTSFVTVLAPHSSDAFLGLGGVWGLGEDYG